MVDGISAGDSSITDVVRADQTVEKRNGWERGQVIRTIQNPDDRKRRAVVQVESRSVVRLA